LQSLSWLTFGSESPKTTKTNYRYETTMGFIFDIES
jgi:hypothetical protein